MTNSSRLARSAAALAVLIIAGNAAAQDSPSGTFTPELGMQWLTGKSIGRDAERNGGHSYGYNAAFGWEHPSGVGVRAVFLFDADAMRGVSFFQQSIKSFDRFYGIEATGSVPLGNALNLKLGGGAGRTRQNVGYANQTHGVPSENMTEGIVSAGLQYRFTRHYAMELRVDHLMRSGVTSAGLQFQVPF